MKKKVYLFTLLLMTVSVMHGQTTHYQLPPHQFDAWGGNDVPVFWHTFNEMACQISDCGTLTTLGLFENHHTKVIGRNGTSDPNNTNWACQLYTVRLTDKNVNGLLTIGKPIIASEELSSSSNHIYTQRYNPNGTPGSYKWTFAGRPDSISVWVRFSFLQNEHDTALMRVHIHGDVDYKDVANWGSSHAQEGKIANAYCLMKNPATTPTNGVYKSDWTRFAFKFRYYKPNNQVINKPTVANTEQPYYILATLTTNRRANVGQNDSIAYDDIFCIYDKSLKSLKFNGVENPEIMTFFNEHEFITHEKTVNSGAITYNYNNLICYNSDADFPQITATANSTLILSCEVTQATIENPYATVTVTHNDNSTYVYTIHFTNAHPAVNVTLNSPTNTYTACEGESITVTASGAENYTWNNDMGTNPTIHPTVSGQYTVTGSNTGGCSGYATAYVVVNPIPNVTIAGGNNIVCAGTNTNLTASGAQTYEWSTGATTASINVPTNNSGIFTYSVTGTSSAGCSNTSTTSVTVQNPPTITIEGPTTICNGTEETITASGASSYTWNTGATGPTLSITTGGVYSVTGTSSGCSSTASWTVNGKPTPSVTINGPSLICGNTSAILTASSNLPGVTYQWATGETSNSITVDSPGFYTVTVSLNGCQNSLTHEVNTTSAPVPPTVTNGYHCGNGSVTLTASSVEGTNCVWYASSTSLDVLAIGNTYTTPYLSVSSTYYVSAQNETCVSDRVPVTANIYSLPIAPTVSSFSHCGETDVTLTATASSYVYWYSDPQGINIITTTSQHVTETTTFYAATINENCRSAIVPLTVTINPLPMAPFVTDPEPICSNSNVNVTLTATPAVGTNVKWYDSNMNYVGQGNTYQAKNISSSTVFYATAYNSDCESEPVAVNIAKNPLPAAPTVIGDTICAAGTATLTANAGNLTVRWYDANNNFLAEGNTYSPNITATTTFKATAYNTETLCESAPTNVTAVVGQEYNHDITVETCEAYTWHGNTYPQSGDYTVTLQSIYGCDSIVTLHLQIFESFNVVIDTSVCGQFEWMGQTYTSSQTIVNHFYSTTNCDSTVTVHLTIYNSVQTYKTATVCSNELPYHFGGRTFNSAGTYTITIPGEYGCDSTITLTLNVNTQPSLPTLTSSNITHCGGENIPLNGTVTANGTVCRWYMSETGGEPFMTANNFQYTFEESGTVYVSNYNANTGCESGRIPMHITINPVPSEPEVEPVVRCDAGPVTFTAIADEGTTCLWYYNLSTANALAAGNTFTRNVVASTTFYVQSLNMSTGCSSARVPAVVTVNIPPSPPQTTPVSNCGPLTADLANYVSSSNMQYRWYDQNGALLSENYHYNATVNETSIFYVSLFNTFTVCESSHSPLTITINEDYAPADIYDTVCQYSRYQNHNIDQIFVTPGTTNLTVNTLSSTGCDSLVTLHLYVRPQITHEANITSCDQYIWGDSVYTTSGIYTQTFTAANGCDSVVTIHLTVTPSDHTDFYEIACEQFVWNDITYTQSGTYQQTFTNTLSCDSVVTLHLTINPAYHEELVVDACEEYTLNEITYQESGDYTQYYTTGHNCDSIINLHLTIYHHQEVVLQDEICENSAYTLNGFDTTFAVAGEYTLTNYGSDIHGCDSTTILHLTVKPVFNTVFESSICYNDSYEFFGETLTESGTYTENLQTVNGCDSIITLYLTVFPQKIDTITAYTCYNVSYHNNGFDIYHPTEEGFYTNTDYDENDCDSTTVLHLFVRDTAATSLSATLCIGETYTENGFDVIATEAGEFTYIQTQPMVNGCDSTITLTVTVNPSNDREIYDTACAGSAYTQFGFDTLCANAGEYTLVRHASNVFGCDSATTLHLTVLPTYAPTIISMICESGSYLFNGETLTQSGIYTANLTSIHGCDSIVTLSLTVGAEYRDTIVDHICAGNAYHQNGFDIDQPQTQYYQRTDTAQNGCDSTTILYLIVHELNTTNIPATICLGESYTQNGFNVTPDKAGDTTFTRVVPTAYNCDSTVVLHLTVNPTHSITLEDAICAGNPYIANGFDTLFTQAGEYTLTNTDLNTYGCDSVTTLHLTVYPIPQTEINTAICFNESYPFNGQSLTAAGTYFDTLASAHNCDSIVTLHLTVYPEKRDTIVAHICKGTSYNDFGFDIETPEMTDYHTVVVPDINGCDSTTVLHLFVHDSAVTHIPAAICFGESYNENGFEISSAEVGEHTYTQLLQTSFGCDSIVYLHLTVNPTYYLTDELTVCQSETPYLYEPADQYFDVANAGDFDAVLSYSTTAGCDSNITLTFHVLPSYILEESVTLCNNSELLPYTFGDMSLTESGDYTYTFTTVTGCDSIVTLHLTVNHTDTVELTQDVCGELLWNGIPYTESGTYSQSFENMNGCDSTVILHLTVFPVYQTEFSETVCGSYTWNDVTYTESGDHIQHLSTVNSCDSTVTLHLTVKPVSLVEHAVSVCLGETFNLYGFDTLVTTAGTHILTHHDVNVFDCDSITTITLTVNPTYSIDTTVNVCDMDIPFLWDDSEYHSYAETGDYDIPFLTANNCDSVIHLHLIVNPSYVKDTTVTVCNGALPYVFCDGYTFTETGNYTVNLQSVSGCDSVWHLHLIVTPNAEHDAFITICDNELPYNYKGETFEEAGYYDITETDIDNCITITHLTLNVNPTYHGYDTVTVCEETLPYIYGTTPLNATGDHDVHLNASTLCDSLITVHFTVIPSARGTEEQYVCSSDFPVSFGGSLFEAGGVYEVAFPREGQCDSIVTFTLHEAPEYLFEEVESVCDHTLPYLWHGLTLNESGIYFDSLTSMYGCDSIYRLQLTVNETQWVGSDPIVLCEGETTEWRNLTLSEAGIYRDTVTSAETGCYEIHQVTVIVNPSYLFQDTVTLCSSELPYHWHELIINEEGIREIYLQTAESYCDSIFRLVLYVHPSYHFTESAAVCDYELPYEWRGMSLTESGDYHDTLTTVDGCDSIYTISFVAYPSVNTTLIDTVCSNDLPYVWRGHQLTTTGSYYDTIPNAYGCQDVYGLQLTVNQTSDTTIQDVVCAGDTYTLNGFNIPTDHPSILYDQRVTVNSQGCDSTIFIMLEVLPSYLTETYGETCENVPYEWRNGEYSVEGTYYDSLTTVSGCDSVFVLHLSINPVYDVYVSDTAIREHEYTYENFVITPADSGTFTYEIQNYTIFGCDSITHLTLYVAYNDGIDDLTIIPEFTFYPNPTSAKLNIQGGQMRQVEVFSINGKLICRENADSPEFTQLDVMNLPTGHYLVRVTLDDGKTVTRKIIVNKR